MVIGLHHHAYGGVGSDDGGLLLCDKCPNSNTAQWGDENAAEAWKGPNAFASVVVTCQAITSRIGQMKDSP
jgi:hypothetical protein